MSGRAAPFDGAASTYDEQFARRPVGQLLRRAVWREIEPRLPPHARVLDLGCGTGEDACRLAARGARVTALDRSSGMIATARAKVAAAGLADRVGFALTDLAELDPRDDPFATHPPSGEHLPFDFALADMGPVNCLAERRQLAESLWHALRPRGEFAAVVMGPVCAWEIAWHLLHGEPRRAFRRLRPNGQTAPAAAPPHGGAERIAVFYPSAGELRRELAPWFRRKRLVGIGLFVPPPYLAHLVDRWPRLAALAATLDRLLAAVPPLAGLADHYLAVFERRDVPGAAARRPADRDPLAATPAHPLRRRIWRRLLELRFRLFDRHRLGRSLRERVGRRELAVAPGVFPPVIFRTAPFFASAIAAATFPPDARILDLGTGSGIGALLALDTAEGTRAVATDLDERAVACARQNAASWGLGERFEARTGDLFAPVAGETFDVVLFHPPFWSAAGRPDPQLRGYESAFYAPPDLPARFADGLARQLRPGGYALVLLSSQGMESAFLGACRAAGHALALVLRRDFGSEWMSAYRVRPAATDGARA